MLHLEKLSLSVALGWTEQERSVPQQVDLDIEIGFAQLPSACDDDELNNTLCYDQLSQKINKMVLQREFRLLESLAKAIFKLVCSQLVEEDSVKITVSKNPPMDQLMRASFTIKRASSRS